MKYVIKQLVIARNTIGTLAMLILVFWTGKTIYLVGYSYHENAEYIPNSLEESSKSKMLISEYRAFPDTFTISSQGQFIFQDIWLEMKARYNDSCEEGIYVFHNTSTGFLRMTFQQNKKPLYDSMGGSYFFFIVGSETGRVQYPLGNSEVKTEISLPSSDTVQLELRYKGSDFRTDLLNHYVITKFTLIRKIEATKE